MTAGERAVICSLKCQTKSTIAWINKNINSVFICFLQVFIFIYIKEKFFSKLGCKQKVIHSERAILWMKIRIEIFYLCEQLYQLHFHKQKAANSSYKCTIIAWKYIFVYNPNQPESTFINLYQPISTSINPNQPESTRINQNQPESTRINRIKLYRPVSHINLY